MRIGGVARLARVRVDTVRYYERRGVLPKAPRRPSGYREFGPESVERIRFAKQAQELGFTLAEVVTILKAFDSERVSCEHLRPYVAGALSRVEEKLGALRRVRGRLRKVLAQCDSGTCTEAETLAPRLRGRRP